LLVIEICNSIVSGRKIATVSLNYKLILKDVKKKNITDGRGRKSGKDTISSGISSTRGIEM
jgi:hypothetical protein